MTLTDIIILLITLLLVAIIVYFRFIKNRGKGECSYCSSAKPKESSLLKDYYKAKCEGKLKK